jgi:hypothetical protein
LLRRQVLGGEINYVGLKEKFRTAVAKAEGVLDSEITGVFKEVLRTME